MRGLPTPSGVRAPCYHRAVLRTVVLGVANRPAVRRAVTGGLGRRVALRFVAGEDLEHALSTIRRLNESGATVSIDCLGENVTDLDQAAAARDLYVGDIFTQAV